MKQFDVFEASGGALYCILQHDLLHQTDTVMAAPLIDHRYGSLPRVMPKVTFKDARYIVDILQQITLPAKPMRAQKPSGSVARHRDDILDAINLLYWGL